MYLNSVAITIDDNYLQHACVMLKSLEANVKAPLNVHCVYNDLSKKNITVLRRLFNSSNIHLNFVLFDSRVLPQLPIKSTDHVTSAAFFRIWLPHLFPHQKQMLFLDTDIIINGDVSELLNLDISGYPLAAVPEFGTSNEKKQSLGIEVGHSYINSGVLLLSLDYFRKSALTEKISTFIIEHPELCEFWDQDAINAVISGQFYRMDYKYNVQSNFYDKSISDRFISNAISNPVIIHFTGGGSCKPWYYKNTHPLQALYYKYLKLTPFRLYYPPDIPRSWRVFRIMKFLVLHR
jgi:lipopolysaccharide biosynthesis glycosyltransferase